MLRGAIIGLGNVALEVHLPGWKRREDVEIVAVTDVSPERRVSDSSALPDARWYGATSAPRRRATPF